MAGLALSVEIFYTVSCAIIDLVVLLINPIIIGVIRSDRQMRRQPSIIYIANLTLVDLCLAAVNLLNILFHFMHVTRIYPICTIFHGYIPLSLILASFLFMFTNSIDRFIFIRMSMRYHSIMKSRVAKRVAFGIWAGSLLFPIIPNVIVEHSWEYKDCSYMSDSEAYRDALLPVLVIFLITVVFTPLMFVSVFRVVKKSRRLRHVTKRSTSMDSFTTTISSPMMTFPTPTLPPISELIAYEHEHCQDLHSRETGRPYLVSSFSTDSSAVGDGIPFPATMHGACSMPLPSEDMPPYLRDSSANHESIVQTLASANVEDMSFAAQNNDLRSRKQAKMLQPEGKRKNPWTFPPLPRPVIESPEEALGDLNKTGPKDNVVYRNNVQENMSVLRMINYSAVNPLVEFYLRSVSVTHEERVQSYSDGENGVNVQRLEQTPSDTMRHFKKDCDKFHSKRKHRKHRSGHGNKDKQFGPDFIKTKRRRKPWRRRSKVETTIPTEPLEMLNFKLQMWNTNTSMNSSTLQQEATFSSGETPFGTLSDGVLSNPTSEKEPHTRRKSLRFRALKLGSFHAPRIRTRTISASDSSSLISTESTSSLSLGTTNENSPNLSRRNDLSLYSTQSEAMYKISVMQKKSATAACTDQPVFPISSLEASQRIYILSTHEERRIPFERPQRPNKLSFRHRNLSGSSDNQNLTPKLKRRIYERNISTSSSTSSAPFGTPSYSGRDLRTLKILFIMFCVYIILWLPSFIIHTVRHFGFNVSLEIAVIGYTLGVSNSVFNFFVYPMRIPKLRFRFKQLLRVAIGDVKKYVRWLLSVTKFKEK